MPTLLTYPRTGTHWTRRRIRAMSREAGGMGYSSFRTTHAVFHPRFYKYGKECPRPWKPDVPGPIYGLVREATKVVVSNWYWLKSDRPNPDQWDEYHHPDYETLETYAAYGTKRYVGYLDWLGELGVEEVFFYEDSGTEEFVRDKIPKILGIDDRFTPTQEQVEAVMEVGKAVVNLVGAKHNEVPITVIETIRKEIQACRLLEYRQRYLETP